MTLYSPTPTRALRIALASALTAGCALAAAQAPASGPLLVAPEIQRQGDVAYVSGGIGSAGQRQTIDLGSAMSLKLVFARASDGAYLADVAVTITDAQSRKVLELPSSDPLLFVQLPPGSYRVSARVNGKTIERQVKVPASGQHMESFLWRDTAAAADAPQ